MNMALTTIEAEVMNVSASERTYLLDRLTASLAGDADSQAASAAEAARRNFSAPPSWPGARIDAL
jgi:hypothetical protein